MPESFESLTADEIELIRMVASGLLEKEIAVQTCGTIKAVEARTYRLRKKLGVKDRVDIAKLAIEASLQLSISHIEDSPAPDILSDRQREILALVGTGLRMKDVAELAGLSVKAASNHKDRAMHRLKLRDRVAVFHYCRKHELVPPSDQQT